MARVPSKSLAGAADHPLGEVGLPARPVVAAAGDLVDDHPEAAGARRIGDPLGRRRLLLGAVLDRLDGRLARRCRRAPGTRAIDLVARDHPAPVLRQLRSDRAALDRQERVGVADDRQQRDRVLGVELLGDARRHPARDRRDRRDEVRRLGRQPVAEQGAAGDPGDEDPAAVGPVAAGQLVDDRPEEGDVVDRMGELVVVPERRDAPAPDDRRGGAVVPVPPDPLREDREEALVDGQLGEPGIRRDRLRRAALAVEARSRPAAARSGPAGRRPSSDGRARRPRRHDRPPRRPVRPASPATVGSPASNASHATAANMIILPVNGSNGAGTRPSRAPDSASPSRIPRNRHDRPDEKNSPRHPEQIDTGTRNPYHPYTETRAESAVVGRVRSREVAPSGVAGCTRWLLESEGGDGTSGKRCTACRSIRMRPILRGARHDDPVSRHLRGPRRALRHARGQGPATRRTGSSTTSPPGRR